MIEAVFVFGIMNCIFEFIVLCMMPPRTRLRVLGSQAKSNAMHIAFLTFNLIVHWGTVTGTMSAIGAFLCSMLTIRVARLIFGYVSDTTYRVGVVKFSREELV